MMLTSATILLSCALLAACGGGSVDGADQNSASGQTSASGDSGTDSGTVDDGNTAPDESTETPVAPEEATDMVNITASIAELVANLVTAEAPNGSSADVVAALNGAGPGLVLDAQALSTDNAVVLTVAANQTDLNDPGKYQMAPIDSYLSIDVLFESEFSCTVAIPNMSTSTDTVTLEFSAEQAIASASIRCGQ